MLVLLLLAAAAPALTPPSQPEPAAAPAKAPPSIADALALLHKAYRDSPVTDRLTFRAVAGERERRVQAVIYVDRGTEKPAAPPAEPAPGEAPKPEDAKPSPETPKPDAKARPMQARIDLGGQLQIHIKDGTLTALNVFDRTTYFRAECGQDIPAALAAHFPPIPVPQLSLAFASEATFANPTPITAGAQWTSVEAAAEFGRPMLILKGQCNRGPITCTLDRQSGRLRKFTAEFNGAAGQAPSRIEILSSPGDSGDSKNWGLPIGGRTRVDSPALLVPPRSGLAAGSSIKHVSLMTPESAAVEPESLFRAAPAAAAPGAPAASAAPGLIALVAFRSDAFASGSSEADLSAALAAAKDAAADGSVQETRTAVRPVGLLGRNEMDPEKNAAIAVKAGAVAAKAGVSVDRGSLITVSEVLTVERGGQPVDVAVIIVGADLKVRGVVVADRRSKEQQALRDEILAVIQGKPEKKPEPRPGAAKPDEPKGPSGVK